MVVKMTMITMMEGMKWLIKLCLKSTLPLKI